MQNTMLDSTSSCISSTLNFACDVDGVHTELAIPPSAWDVENETVWLTQAQLAELYKVNVPAVSKQIQNVFEDDELQADSVIKESFITAADGKSYRTKLYNLEMLIALGYRIRSKVATKFRQWATKHLKELMTKGHTEIITQPEMSDAEIMSRALEIAHRTLAHREERIKALEAERDEAIRTKAMIGSSRSGSLLGLLHRRERDSRIFTNDEIIFDDFKGKESLHLANRGNTFVSLSGFLEILSKTELSSDKIDDFQACLRKTKTKTKTKTKSNAVTT